MDIPCGKSDDRRAARSGTLEAALDHARRLLDADPPACVLQAREILATVPGHPVALWLLGAALRRCGQTAAALELLAPLAAAQPQAAQVHYEHGCALADAGQSEAALAAWRRALEINADLADAWRALADESLRVGDGAAADQAFAQLIRAGTRDPGLLAAADALCRNDIPLAETLLRDRLKAHPTDVAAIRMFAEVAGRLRRYRDAEQLLERCLELAPGFQCSPLRLCGRPNWQGQVRPPRSEQAGQLHRADASQPRLPQPAGDGAGSA